ncbi:MAG: hypothetical protein WBF58_17810, partial [Xanthobacteraceae bacterium]
LGRAIAFTGNEGPVELGKLEALYAALRRASALRRTLAGSLVTLAGGRLSIERAPARRAGHSRHVLRASAMRQNGKARFTK